MEERRSIDEADLHAFVDGHLDPARTRELMLYLDEHPEALARIEAYQEQNQKLRALFDAEGLHAAAPRPKRAASVRMLPYAAVFVLALLAGGAGWILRGSVSIPVRFAAVLPREAAIAHIVYAPEVRHPVEVTAAQEKHLASWLSHRLGTSVHPPRLGQIGYELLGGRLLPGDNGPAAQFMYQDKHGRRLTLYVRAMHDNSRETAFRYAREGEVSVFYWIDGSLGYALSGNVPKADLLKIADAVYEDLVP